MGKLFSKQTPDTRSQDRKRDGMKNNLIPSQDSQIMRGSFLKQARDVHREVGGVGGASARRVRIDKALNRLALLFPALQGSPRLPLAGNAINGRPSHDSVVQRSPPSESLILKTAHPLPFQGIPNICTAAEWTRTTEPSSRPALCRILKQKGCRVKCHLLTPAFRFLTVLIRVRSQWSDSRSNSLPRR
ncbi:hypothetical protein AAFF_G00103760 [Aldrovandia affinis]|uniref:Uncharacterized protein n=1 Tax=Aldrovandia affinis TaxID=143900 RepID=A0AAD7RWQ9_9TELE|nr:hypothetical protein AAFF_G00103760 [Aldrovandia affinis]